ncbi:MAG: ATP-binding protein [Steroidobacteraceae bacterium]
MARHFLGLYLLIVLTLAAVSWGQDKVLLLHSGQESSSDASQATALYALEARLEEVPQNEWSRLIAGFAAKAGAGIELLARKDIAGRQVLEELARGGIAYLQSSSGDWWALKQLNGDYVLAFRSSDPQPQRTPLEWALSALFYAIIALVIMVWLWPLTRDVRALERAAARFGDRNWAFHVDIKPRSQIFALAQTFRKMALRIDGLIASHTDMSNAVSHEIKTPLARMQFEIELAQQSREIEQIKSSLANVKSDAAAINDLVSATMSYAILERANMKLNVGTHDFTALVPAIVESVRRNFRPGLEMSTQVSAGSDAVVCDLHLMETVLKNLLYNAARHARSEVRVSFDVRDGVNRLIVDDDGPGIPEKDRQRVFESFVQLDPSAATKSGFGLGLAIVRRAVEWHGGEVRATESPLGGARLCASWPTMRASASRA